MVKENHRLMVRRKSAVSSTDDRLKLATTRPVLSCKRRHWVRRSHHRRPPGDLAASQQAISKLVTFIILTAVQDLHAVAYLELLHSRTCCAS
jgi:hypothetical protein